MKVYAMNNVTEPMKIVLKLKVQRKEWKHGYEAFYLKIFLFFQQQALNTDYLIFVNIKVFGHNIETKAQLFLFRSINGFLNNKALYFHNHQTAQQAVSGS